MDTHEDILQTRAQNGLVIVQRPGRRWLQLEILCRSRSASVALLNEFGGQIDKLPRDWLERFQFRNRKPIRIGKRLIVAGSINELRGCNVRRSKRIPVRRVRPAALRTGRSTACDLKPSLVLIPASTAFGTGEHATTAMSLRLLEELTRHWKRGWSLVDLGTGSGILALAAKRFGAGRVLGVDIDSTAISMAKSNARLNKIRGATFQRGDVHEWKAARETDVIMANLYCNLLMEILPNLRRSGWLILSGILRKQETEFLQALSENRLESVSIKRRGKWIAILARSSGDLQECLQAAKFCGGHRPPLQ